MRSALRVLAILITLLFPLALWLGEGRVAPAWLAALLLLVGMARLPAAAPTGATRYWAGGHDSAGDLDVLVRRFVAAKILSGAG